MTHYQTCCTYLVLVLLLVLASQVFVLNCDQVLLAKRIFVGSGKHVICMFLKTFLLPFISIVCSDEIFLQGIATMNGPSWTSPTNLRWPSAPILNFVQC